MSTAVNAAGNHKELRAGNQAGQELVLTTVEELCSQGSLAVW